jgi:uncharacterized protein
VYFSTQAPTDVPDAVLAQLGNRVQHALRAFTPNDADALRKASRTFPSSAFYPQVDQVITSLGIGEALVTVLAPNGVPTPLAATRLEPPDSRMGALDPTTFQGVVASGSLRAKYGTPVDSQSAREIITARIQQAQAAAAQQAGAAPTGVAPTAAPTYAQGVQAERARQAAIRAQQAEARAEQAQARAAAKAQATAERQRQRSIDTGIRTAGRILTSRTGQDVVRSVFGTLFGKH